MSEVREGNQPIPTQLLPGGDSGEGFLTAGQTLEGLTKRDNEALLVLGYTKDEIAELIETALGSVNPFIRGQRYTAPNGKSYEVRGISYRGVQNCPWRDVQSVPDSSVDFYFKTNDKETRIPGMLPHLIRNHDFFEGGSYRTAPEDIVEMFGEERNPGSIQAARKLQLA